MSFRTGERTCPHIKFNVFFFFFSKKSKINRWYLTHQADLSLILYPTRERERETGGIEVYIDSKSLYTSSLSLSLSIYLITYLYNRDGYIEVQTDVTSSLIHTSLSICLYICLYLYVYLSLVSSHIFYIRPCIYSFLPSFVWTFMVSLFCSNNNVIRCPKIICCFWKE